MIRPTKKLHLRTESIRVLTPDALRGVPGGLLLVERCTKNYSGCNPTTTLPTLDCTEACNTETR